MAAEQPLKYKRILLKLSGEALAGPDPFGINSDTLTSIANQISHLHQHKVQIALVVGAGNLFRGKKLEEAGIDRVTGDQMGMLATVMNALALRDALDQVKVPARVMSAISIAGFADDFNSRSAISHLNNSEVMIFSAGTGNPFFTTDTAACLRAIEIRADLMLKATKVNGVYDKDPMVDSSAKKFDRLSYDQVLASSLGVMDLSAICLARDHALPVRVFNMQKLGALKEIIQGGNEGTLISEVTND